MMNNDDRQRKYEQFLFDRAKPIPLSDDYTIVCVLGPQVSVRKVVRPSRRTYKELPRMTTTYMTDEEVRAYARQFDDVGFEKLPDWLKFELRMRGLTWQPRELQSDSVALYKNFIQREPSEDEKRETEADLFIHKQMNNDLELHDYLDILNGKDYTNV
jgi:hypothetical protein